MRFSDTFNLFFEKKFVYDKDKPGGREVVSKKPERVAETKKLATMQDLKDRIKHAGGKLGKVRNKGKRKKLKAKLDNVERKLAFINALPEKQKQKIITETYNKIGKKMTKHRIEFRPKKPPAKPTATPRTTSTTPKKAPGAAKKSSAKPAETPKIPKRRPAKYTPLEIKNGPAEKKLLGSLKYIDRNGRSGFNQMRPVLEREVGRITKSMPPGKEGFVQRVDLPDGYSVAKMKLPKDKSGFTSEVILKGEKLICYKDYMGWHHAEDIGPHGRIDSVGKQALRIAQIIKCNALLPRAMHQMIESPPGKISFKNPQAKKDFRMALKGMARFSGRNVKTFMARFKMAKVIFNRSSNPEHGEFEIILNVGGLQKTLFYNTASDRLGIATFDKNSVLTSKYGTEEVGAWSPEQSKKFDKDQSTLKKARERRSRRLESKLGTENKIAVTTDLISKGAIEKGAIARISETSFTVKSTTREGKKYIGKARIHKLLNLRAVKGKLVYITITSKKGRVKKGLYIPGQKTAYKLDKRGRQRRKRLTFKNGDKISVRYAPPPKNLKKIVNRRDRRVLKVETMATYSRLRNYEAKFRKYKLMGGSEKKLAQFTKNEKLKSLFTKYPSKGKKDFDALKKIREQVGKVIAAEGEKTAVALIHAEDKAIDKAITAQRKANKDAMSGMTVEQAEVENFMSDYTTKHAEFIKHKGKLKDLNLKPLR
ncbi:hypothetical protein ACFLZH_05825, partial [Patescibacteria group bacterium]